MIAQPRFGRAAIFFFLAVRPTVLVAAFLAVTFFEVAVVRRVVVLLRVVFPVVAFFFDVFFRAVRPDSPNAAS